MLRKKGVVGKFVEFYGAGLNAMTVADRATLANMAPEYGATCGLFPIDSQTLTYLKTTGRKPSRLALVEAYAKAQGVYRTRLTSDPVFTDTLELNLGEVTASLAGPKRPQDRVVLNDAKAGFIAAMSSEFRQGDSIAERHKVEGTNYDLGHGDVVIAAITSCTNTSNPNVMMAAGLLARNAVARGLTVKPWVKTSLAPGSQVVQYYLKEADLQKSLDKLGFNIVGFGCTTCIGNSGPLAPEISATVAKHNLVAAAVLSGNRNFEGRVNPDVRANYLASPPLVVAYALAGSMQIDLTREPIGADKQGKAVYLADIWPKTAEIQEFVEATVSAKMFKTKYASVFDGDANWRKVKVPAGLTYAWDIGSTYVQKPPYFDRLTKTPVPVVDIENARILALFLDSITTDHISPAGSIKAASPAGQYLVEHQVRPIDFNQYGTRRGNHEVMMRGTFANIRIKNQMVKDETGNVVEGGYTIMQPSGERLAIYDAATRYQAEKIPLVVFAGREYGTGSSRDWAAKGTKLLGVRAVIAQSFERIHRSNLVGMGVLPLVFEEGTSWVSLGLRGDEIVTIHGLGDALKPRQLLHAEIKHADGRTTKVPLTCRIDTLDELEYFRNDGILPYVLRHLAA
jgi:aconitate hydratase